MFSRRRAEKSARAGNGGSSGARAGLSIIGTDVVIEGHLLTSGDIQIEGSVHGDIRAAGVLIGQNGAVHGGVLAEEVVVRGRVIGPIRGLKVHIAGTAHVEGDVLHGSLGVETGAFVQGTIRQSDDPLSSVQLIETAPSTDSERYDLALPEEVDDDVAEARYVGHRQIRRRPLLLRRRAAE